MLTAIVQGYYLGPESQEEIEIEDLEQWILDHGGAVIVRPPQLHPQGYWVILTSDNNRFTQR